MGRLLILEPFDAPPSLADPPKVSEDWLDGHAAGFAAAQASRDERETSLRNEAIQAIMDMDFTYAEARSQVLRSLVPLLDSLVTQFLPALSRQTTVPTIVDMIMSAAWEDSKAPMVVHLHPDVLPSLQDAFPGSPSFSVALLADETLSPGQAILLHREAETLLDLDGILARIKAIHTSVIVETTERSHHG
jgi:flagellar biosynthesis/type III secretory pathway protein FliH